MPLLRTTDIRPGDAVETAPGEWTVAHGAAGPDGAAPGAPEGGGMLLLDDGGAGPVWSSDGSRRFVMWHVRPGDDADRREIVWSHTFSV